MSAAQRVKTAWKVFSAVGTAYQYDQGMQGKSFDWEDARVRASYGIPPAPLSDKQ